VHSLEVFVSFDKVVILWYFCRKQKKGILIKQHLFEGSARFSLDDLLRFLKVL